MKPQTLNNQQLKKYQTDGYLSALKVLSPSQASMYLAMSNQLELQMGGKPKAIKLTQVHLSFYWAYKLATHPCIVNIVKDILGEDILIWATSIFSKHGNDPSFVSYHQDEKYWGLDSDQVASCWISLTGSTVENGAMRVVPKSHQGKIMIHEETFATNNMLTRGQAISSNFDEAIPLVLNQGQMSIHHIRIIHGSKPNKTAQKRVGFVVRYINPSVKQIGQRPKAILVCGENRYDNYEIVEPPFSSFSINEVVANHEQVAVEFLNQVASSYKNAL
jgi:non-haem Fe2+, alpha-ketoglutarate-dependent halogenase